MYEYKIKIVKVYDADTIKGFIDLGFGVTLRGNDGKGVSLRFSRINAPEVRGEQREQGLISRDFLRSILLLGETYTIKTTLDKTGKYGRYLADVFVNIDGESVCVNDLLVTKGLAIYQEY